jgi:hypothetical protein
MTLCLIKYTDNLTSPLWDESVEQCARVDEPPIMTLFVLRDSLYHLWTMALYLEDFQFDIEKFNLRGIPLHSRIIIPEK